MSEVNSQQVETSASLVREGFQGNELAVQHETAAIAIAAAEKAAIEARYVLAMRRPRDWDNVLIRMKKECQRPGFAEAAIYRKPVGRKQNDQTGEWEQNYVEGLSVRFAEAAIRHVANFYSSAKSIYDDPSKAIVRVTVMDLESNATIEMDVHVSKTTEKRSLKKGQKPIGERLNSYGEKVFIVSATDDEVLNKTNALISKALRNGVLRLLPGDIQDECEALCRSTMSARDAADPDAAKRKLFDAFAALGIMPDALKDYLGTSAETLQPSELATLRGIFSAIKDGETTWAAIVEARRPAAEGEKKDSAAAKATQDLIDKHAAKAAEKAKKSAAKGTQTPAMQPDPEQKKPAGDPAADSSGNPEPGSEG